MGTFLLLFFVLILFIMFTASGKSGKKPLIFSHWYQQVDQLNHSSQSFYETLEQALQSRNIEGIELDRIDHHEGGVFSAKREYLRVSRKDHIFDICAAPFGNGFFVSWWLGEKTSGFWEFMMKIPFLGPALFAAFRPETYYRIDTTLMFQSSVHSTVLEVLDDCTKSQGLRSLSELERKPIMSDLFKR